MCVIELSDIDILNFDLYETETVVSYCVFYCNDGIHFADCYNKDNVIFNVSAFVLTFTK